MIKNKKWVYGRNWSQYWFFVSLSIIPLIFILLTHRLIAIAIYWSIFTLIVWFFKEIYLETDIEISVADEDTIPEHRKLAVSYGLDDYLIIKRRDLYQE
jgi:hypothetical protein